MRVGSLFSVLGSALLAICPAAMAEEDVIVASEELSAVPASQTEEMLSYSTQWVQQIAPDTPRGNDIQFHGYLNAGGMFNDHGANYNVISVNSDNQIGLDGACAWIGKDARTGHGTVDWGFGLDAFFGRDARFLSSYAGFDSSMETGHRSDYINGWGLDYDNESYGFAFPQVYGEMSVKDVVVKMGHFYTPFGYESARASERFFYSFGRNEEVNPVSHTGVLATYKGFDGMELTGGWVMGENNLFERGYGESLVIGSVNFFNQDRTSLRYDILKGDGAVQGLAGDLFRNDLVFETKIDSNWETAFVFNYVEFTSYDGPAGAFTGDITTYMALGGLDAFKYESLAGFVYYDLCPGWKLGTRTEWQRGWYGDNSYEWIDLGLGANWAPMKGDNFLIRPEIRYDRAVVPIFADASDPKDDQLTFGFDVLCKI